MCHVCGSSETFKGVWNMMCCFTLSQAIFLRKFLHALKEKSQSDNTTNAVTWKLIWAVGLLVTELVSVFLIAWSLSILYRLACS